MVLIYLVSVLPSCRLAPPSSPTLASDHPHVFKKDVVERAKAYTAGLGGGVGAYTNSQGIPAVREVNYDVMTLLIIRCTIVISRNNITWFSSFYMCGELTCCLRYSGT